MTQRSNDFLIWRAGTSVGWDCTQQEIANEVGLSNVAVSLACKRHAWKCLGGQNGGHRDRFAADTLMQSPFIAGRFKA
jgi:hypothetical protein